MKVKPINEPSELIMRLAERVRAARSKAGMPRRELSELSGVSPRYLAQLEAGESNISVLCWNGWQVRLSFGLKISLSLAPRFQKTPNASHNYIKWHTVR